MRLVGSIALAMVCPAAASPDRDCTVAFAPFLYFIQFLFLGALPPGGLAMVITSRPFLSLLFTAAFADPLVSLSDAGLQLSHPQPRAGPREDKIIQSSGFHSHLGFLKLAPLFCDDDLHKASDVICHEPRNGSLSG